MAAGRPSGPANLAAACTSEAIPRTVAVAVAVAVADAAAAAAVSIWPSQSSYTYDTGPGDPTR